MFEAQFFLTDAFPLRELRGGHPAGHGNMLHGRSQILAERKDVNRRIPYVGHGLADFVLFLSHPQNHAGLGQDGRGDPFGGTQEGDRAPIAPPRTHVRVKS